MIEHKSTITSPQGGMIIWNYADRITSDMTEGDPNKIGNVIVPNDFIVSMSTSKSKSAPAGSFEVHLAPALNWTSVITPGSWCVILMSRDINLGKMSATNTGKADRKTLKMLGRIHEVRLSVEVDPETGARQSQYIVTGQDWGSVFDSVLYIDPIIRNTVADTSIGQAERILYGNQLLEWSQNEVPLPTSTQAVAAIIKLWGSPALDVSNALDSAIGNPLKSSNYLEISSGSQFTLPRSVAQYMGLGSFASTSVSFSSLIKSGLRSGTLKGYDSYSGDNQEAYGILDPTSVLGIHTFWQLLMDNCNPVINELVTDIRWEKEKPYLALYKRARPFINRKAFPGSDEKEAKLNISMFSNVRRISIPLNDVVSINVGTNWRDKINFIEIRPSTNLNDDAYEVAVKTKMQSVDRSAYQREGFKPLIQSAKYLPIRDSSISALNATQWKNLLREWHFNTHLMFNGSMTIMGQNEYIQVGDNIMVDSKVLGSSLSGTNNNAGQVAKKDSFFLAHVESINHRFTVDSNGSRSFITSIQFVRGIITDANGKILGASEGGLDIGFSADSLGFGDSSLGSKATGAIDKNTKDLSTKDQVNKNVIFTKNNGGSK